jgi:Mce-associated membrane protein
MTTPSRNPAPPRRRPTGIRRPRVAGRAPHHGESPVSAHRVPLSGTPDADTRPAAWHRFRRPVPMPALVGALVVLVGLAVFAAVENADVRDTPSAQNTALVDIGTTAQVSRQVTAALKTVYSFDYTRLDQNEAAARAVITPAFAGQFDQLFRQVRELAPQQQAVVTATVNLVGVQSINGDTATLLVFLDQQATRAQAGGGPQQLAAAGRLTVTAQLVDGTWKIAAVDPR